MRLILDGFITVPLCLIWASPSLADDKVICSAAIGQWQANGKSMDKRAREIFISEIPSPCAELLQRVRETDVNFRNQSVISNTVTHQEKEKQKQPPPKLRVSRQRSSDLHKLVTDSKSINHLESSEKSLDGMNQNNGSPITLYSSVLPKPVSQTAVQSVGSAMFYLESPLVKISNFQSWIRNDGRTVYTIATLTPLTGPILPFDTPDVSNVTISVGTQDCETDRKSIAGFWHYSGYTTLESLADEKPISTGSSYAIGFPAICSQEPHVGDRIHLKALLRFYGSGNITDLTVDADLPPLGDSHDVS